MRFLLKIYLALMLAVCPALPALAQTDAASAQQTAPAAAKILGSVAAIDGDILTITSASGAATKIQVQQSTQIVRAEPGRRDLKDATPISVKDLQTGDRVLARVKPGVDSAPGIASSIIVMKKSDITEKQQHDISEWQQHGAGGLVTAIDAPAGTVTISSAGFGLSHEITVHTSPATLVRRYAPDSIKFDDAKPSKLEEVKRGDQLRARGTRSSDGLSITADEIVFGAFRNLAGTVSAVDAAQNTLELQDLLSKKKVTVRIRLDSQLRKLPQMMAERIAARFKAGPPTPPDGGSAPPPLPDGQSPGGGRGFGGGAARGDFQQMLARLPQIALADMQKGDVILMVATEGGADSDADSAPVAITLVSGAEPILSAAPDANRAATLLSPWNLSGGAGADAGGGLP
jgi:hypothetical protein